MDVQSTGESLRNAGETLLNSGNTEKPAGDQLGKEDFLRLLMTQMTNQDPLSPLDSKGMMEQFAQMGSLEQLTNIGKQLENLNRVQADIVQSTTATYLDKDVTVKGGSATVAEGQAPAVQYRIPADANVKVTIQDAGGSPVRTLDLGYRRAGEHQVAWNGIDADGDVVPNGRYDYRVRAAKADGTEVPVSTFVQGKVSGVKFEDGKQYIRMNGETFGLDEVVSVSNESERLFGDRAPMGPRNELTPMPPVLESPR